MTKDTPKRILTKPKTIYGIVTKEEVDIQLYKAGFSEEELKAMRQDYYNPSAPNEEVVSLLKALKEDLVSNLNESDPSVGLHPVTDLVDWSKDAFEETTDITMVSVSTTNLIFNSKGYLFEIFESMEQVDEDEYDYYWNIREYEPTEDAL